MIKLNEKFESVSKHVKDILPTVVCYPSSLRTLNLTKLPNIHKLGGE